MDRCRPGLVPVACAAVLLTAGCREDSHGPFSRPEVLPPIQETPEGSALAPLDLIYVCGNNFLVTNATPSTVHVTYRVVRTQESGGLTLREASAEDEGHSETELKATSRGAVELYHEDRLVARRHNENLPCGPSASLSSFAVEAGESGSWSSPFSWPVVALHISMLPTGSILSWGFSGEPHVWDPVTGDFSEIPVDSRLFCSGHTLLDDGRVLVVGGHITNGHGLPDVNIFNPASANWSRSTPMRKGRWYPTSTTMANGDVLILSGRDEAGVLVDDPEVWSPGGIRVLSTASRTLPYYPRAFLAPNGKLFLAGIQQTTRYLDVAGTGAWTTVGERLYGQRDYGAAVMYDAGKILYVGGGRTTNTAEIIDLNSPSPDWQWTGSMSIPRRHLNATVLPSGDVLVTGGTSGSGFNDLSTAVRSAELWSPETGSWTRLASNAVNRGYHSTSLLLPDGRVLHTGSGDGAGAPSERNAELFSPPYLFKGPRPTITGGPSLVAYGNSFKVSTPDANDVDRVSLVRLSSVTHAFNMNQRFQWLSFERLSGAVSIDLPASRNRTPPGHYMLFLLRNGVPSVGKIVKVGSEAESGPPSNNPPSAGFIVNCAGLSCSFTDASTDNDGSVTAWSWTFGDNNSSISTSPEHTYPEAGTYEVTLIATDNGLATASVSKTITVSGPPPPNTAPTAAFSQACDGFTCHFNDGSTDEDGSISEWSWDFGDGSTGASVANPVHTYPEAGDYQVTLTAIDNDHAPVTVTKTVTVTEPPPNTAPTPDFSHTCIGSRCSFSDGSVDEDGRVTSWNWEFGDEATSTTANPTHVYAAEGTYEVKLTVRDDDQAGATITRSISVTPLPSNTAPSAAFSQRCTGLTCEFTSQSTDDDGMVSGWTWDFGDGATAAVEDPSHTYSAAGDYEVTLVATDDGNATGSTTKTIAVTAPPANIAPAAAFSPSCTNLACTFIDASTDPDGTVESRSWNYGDGSTGTGTNPTHTYAAGGTYRVSLRVTDDDGAGGENSATVTVTPPAPAPNSAPAAAFTHTCTGLYCKFADRSTDADGTVTAWKWTFGAGMSGTAQNPSRTYPAPGTYTVTLRVTDNKGATGQVSSAITVGTSSGNRLPTAAFTHSCTGLTCRFTDRSTDTDGTITARSWSLGGGVTSTLTNPSRTYPAAGTVTVSLRVADNANGSSQTSASITVGGTTSSIVLKFTKWVDATKQYVGLTWTGITGPLVDIYRDGRLLRSDINDGKWTHSRALPGATQYTFRVCNTGTTVCSNLVTVTF